MPVQELAQETKPGTPLLPSSASAGGLTLEASVGEGKGGGHGQLSAKLSQKHFSHTQIMNLAANHTNATNSHPSSGQTSLNPISKTQGTS